MASSGVLVLLTVLGWYASNIGVIILNKFLLSSTGFNYPIFLTLCHMVSCTLLGAAISAAGLMPTKPIKSRQQFYKVCVLSAIFCLTIVLGNASLSHIPVSFNQALGATTPFFTAIFSFLLQSQRESAVTYATLVPIAGGIVIASGGEPAFHVLGFVFCLSATACRALKSVIQSLIMTDPSEKLDPMSLLLYMSAVCVMMLAPVAWLMERGAWSAASVLAAKDSGFVWWLLGNSLLAYFQNLLNFLVTKLTSALTLQVLGNAKGVVAAVISVGIFHNKVTWVGAFGYLVTVLGVFAYSEAKRRFKVTPPGVSKGGSGNGSGEGSGGGSDDESSKPLVHEGPLTGSPADKLFRGLKPQESKV